MKKTDTIVDEIHEIRRQINEDTRNMTSSERDVYFNQDTKNALEQSGYKIIYIDEKETQYRIKKI